MFGEKQFGFIYENKTTEAVFILIKMQEEYHSKGKKLHMCLVDIDNAFDRVPSKLL